MPCGLTITSTALDQNTGNVFVQGFLTLFTPCGGSPSVSVTINCGGNSYTGTAALTAITSSQFSWTAIIPTTCPCDVPITVVATNSCPNYTCTANFSGTLCCCPAVSTGVTYGSCTNGFQLVTFDTYIYISGTCTFSFRRDFGDGFFGPVQTFTGPGNFYYQDQHNYAAPGSYTATVDVLPPPISCPAVSTSAVTVSCTGGCYTSPLVAAVCLFLEWLFLFSMTFGLIVGFSQPCVPLVVGAISFGVALLTLFIYLLLQCQLCVCGFFLKWWGQIFIATGFANFMFVLPSCPAITLFPAFINSMILLSLGFIILYIWYIQNKQTCPLIKCDFWCAVSGIQNIRSATNIALIVIFVMLALNPLLIAGVGVAFAIILAFALYIWLYGPISQPPCQTDIDCK